VVAVGAERREPPERSGEARRGRHGVDGQSAGGACPSRPCGGNSRRRPSRLRGGSRRSACAGRRQEWQRQSSAWP
jgi:hypothetical protein